MAKPSISTARQPRSRSKGTIPSFQSPAERIHHEWSTFIKWYDLLEEHHRNLWERSATLTVTDKKLGLSERVTTLADLYNKNELEKRTKAEREWEDRSVRTGLDMSAWDMTEAEERDATRIFGDLKEESPSPASTDEDEDSIFMDSSGLSSSQSSVASRLQASVQPISPIGSFQYPGGLSESLQRSVANAAADISAKNAFPYGDANLHDARADAQQQPSFMRWGSEANLQKSRESASSNTGTASSSSSHLRSHSVPYIGPILYAEPDAKDEDINAIKDGADRAFTEFRQDLRIQMIVVFHDHAREVETKLVRDLFQIQSSEIGKRIDSHKKDMEKLQVFLEQEMGKHVNKEREARLNKHKKWMDARHLRTTLGKEGNARNHPQAHAQNTQPPPPPKPTSKVDRGSTQVDTANSMAPENTSNTKSATTPEGRTKQPRSARYGTTLPDLSPNSTDAKQMHDADEPQRAVPELWVPPAEAYRNDKRVPPREQTQVPKRPGSSIEVRQDVNTAAPEHVANASLDGRASHPRPINEEPLGGTTTEASMTPAAPQPGKDAGVMKTEERRHTGSQRQKVFEIESESDDEQQAQAQRVPEKIAVKLGKNKRKEKVKQAEDSYQKETRQEEGGAGIKVEAKKRAEAAQPITTRVSAVPMAPAASNSSTKEHNAVPSIDELKNQRIQAFIIQQQELFRGHTSVQQLFGDTSTNAARQQDAGPSSRTWTTPGDTDYNWELLNGDASPAYSGSTHATAGSVDDMLNPSYKTVHFASDTPHLHSDTSSQFSYGSFQGDEFWEVIQEESNRSGRELNTMDATKRGIHSEDMGGHVSENPFIEAQRPRDKGKRKQVMGDRRLNDEW